MLFKAICLVLAVAFVQCEDVCVGTDPLLNYMNCLVNRVNGFNTEKGRRPKRYLAFEKEWERGLKRRASQCLSSSDQCDGGLDTYKDGDFLKRNGILHKQCSLCYKVIKLAMNVIDRDVDEAKLSCMRKNMVVEISKELNPCMVSETGYGVDIPLNDETPDFDRVSGALKATKEKIKETISFGAYMYYKIGLCRAEDPEKAATATQCIEDITKFPLKRHCKATTACKSFSLDRYSCDMGLMEGGFCSCLLDARSTIKELVLNVVDILQTYTRNHDALDRTQRTERKALAQKCNRDVVSALVSPKTDRNLVAVVQGMIDNCGNDKNLDIAKYLPKLCSIAKSKSLRDDVPIIVELINSAIDSMMLRLQRFCGQEECK